jgi:hypothetical protein
VELQQLRREVRPYEVKGLGDAIETIYAKEAMSGLTKQFFVTNDAFFTAIVQSFVVYSGKTPATANVYDVDLAKFRRFVQEWKAERDPYSSFSQDNMLFPSYQRIIGLGKPAIPLILSELKDELRRGEPDDWFQALWAIADETPVKEENRGRIRRMAEDWISWGVKSGYVATE